MFARLPSFAAFALLVSALTAACSSSPTQLLVEVDTDFAVPSALSRVDVRTEDESGTLVNSAQFSVLSSGASPESGRYVLPISFGVVPKDGDANRTVLITVEGRLDDSEAVLVERRARVRFREGETIPLSMFLSLACASKVCGEDETCDRGECIPVDVVPVTPDVDLGVLPDLGDVDMGTAPDGETPMDMNTPPDMTVPLDMSPPPDMTVPLDMTPPVDMGTPLYLVTQQAYLKASNSEAGDGFGMNVAISADGNTLAVGTELEDSNATGIGGGQANNDAGIAGAVYVFARSGSTWTQQAYIKASNTEADDRFGSSVALSADGTRLAVGARNESSNASGVGGDQNNNSTSDSGAVYVFVRSGSTWSQEAYVKASNPRAFAAFGTSVALSSDGSRLAVGATGESSSTTGINGTPNNTGASGSGAVYVFVRSGSAWSQEAYIKTQRPAGDANFGISVALSGDGATLAVGAMRESGGTRGINGDQTMLTASQSGAAYVFVRSGTTWTEQAYVKASNADMNDYFGYDVSLSSDGSTLAVGAQWEASSGLPSDNSAGYAGAAYVFVRSGTTWTEQAYLKAPNAGAGDWFGRSLALSGDGSKLLVGALQEDSYASGVNGDMFDDSPSSFANYGAAYMFVRSGASWSHSAYVKASNNLYSGSFGESVAFAGDGTTFVVGATNEDSNATGVGGAQNNDAAEDSGATYVFRSELF